MGSFFPGRPILGDLVYAVGISISKLFCGLKRPSTESMAFPLSVTMTDGPRSITRPPYRPVVGRKSRFVAWRAGHDLDRLWRSAIEMGAGERHWNWPARGGQCSDITRLASI